MRIDDRRNHVRDWCGEVVGPKSFVVGVKRGTGVRGGWGRRHDETPFPAFLPILPFPPLPLVPLNPPFPPNPPFQRHKRGRRTHQDPDNGGGNEEGQKTP